jgi:sugar lactone lactonase YvrE
MQFHLAADTRCDVGESPTWDDRRRLLWFCDIYGGRLHAWSPQQQRLDTHELEAPIGSLGLCDGGQLVVALQRELIVYDPQARRRVRTIARIDAITDHERLNDGKVGPDGCFWVGTVDERPIKEPIGALYRITPAGDVEHKVDGLLCSNGLAWTGDGRSLFHSDSRGCWIDRWAFDPATGAIAHRTRIATPDAAVGRPDGAACDAQGRYWSAGVSAGRLNVFDADGRLLQQLAVPVPSPTMPCITPHGVFLTSLRRGLSADALAAAPHAGGLFLARADLQPARDHRFDFR